MTLMRCIHLNRDFALGGVTKALGLFQHPALGKRVESDVLAVDPSRRSAPVLSCDVIVTHFTPNWSSLPFLFSLRRRNPHAYLVHVEHSYTRAWEAGNVTSRRRFRAMLRMAYGLFDEIVAVSLGQRRWLAHEGLVRPHKLRVLHPWSGTQALDQLAPPRFRDGGTLRIGAMGRFCEAKRFEVAVRTMKHLPADRYQLVLGGFGEQEDMLRAAARGMDHVRFAGRVDDVAAFYANCDLIIAPSRWESFGQVVAEAKLAGRPVITSDVDGLPEQVGLSGLVVNCDKPLRLADAIRSLDAARLTRMSDAARMAMRGAEESRIGAWAALFDRASRQRQQTWLRLAG